MGTPPPHLGVTLPLADELSGSGSLLAAYAQALESAGAESVWASEHVLIADKYEPLYPFASDGVMPVEPALIAQADPLDALAYIGACTTTLKLGTSMLIGPLHSPPVLAKRAATIERLTGERLLLGLSIGWQKEEYEAVGRPYARRGRQLEECVLAMRQLWANSPATYEGEFFAFNAVHCLPRPERRNVHVTLGGESDAAIRRTARVGDGWFPYGLSPDQFRKGVELLHDQMMEAGRSPDEVELTAWPGSFDAARERDVTLVREYVEAGASRIIVNPPPTAVQDVDGAKNAVSTFIHDVLENV